VNAALKAKTWTFEAKAIGPEAKADAKARKFLPQGSLRLRHGLDDYITVKICAKFCSS